MSSATHDGMKAEMNLGATKAAASPNRRAFLGGATTAAAFSIIPRSVLGAPGAPAPSERVNLGVIGTGGQGIEDLTQFLKDPRVQATAVCDVRKSCDYSAFYYGGVKGWAPARDLVNSTYAERQRAGDYRGCEVFTDFREMLDKADVDAVLIATPDHLHAVCAMAAMRAGKHVYCQKPLTYTVREARTLTEAAAKHGVVTQMGHQGHATDELKRAVELVTGGAIGEVREVHCWTAAAYGGVTRPTDTPPVPKDFDWDAWIGPAPFRTYHPAYAPFSWRSWRDFGTGCLGDMGCHILDPALWALGFPKRMTIEARSSAVSEESWALANVVRYEFTAPLTGAPVTLTWYDGGMKPFAPKGLEGVELPASGGLFVGEEGMILRQHGGEAQLFPASKRSTQTTIKSTLPRGETHYEEWVRACRGGAAPLSNFSYAGPLTEMVLLGNAAIATGKRLEWDSEKFAFTNDAAANQLLERKNRAGWEM